MYAIALCYIRTSILPHFSGTVELVHGLINLTKCQPSQALCIIAHCRPSSHVCVCGGGGGGGGGGA